MDNRSIDVLRLAVDEGLLTPGEVGIRDTDSHLQELVRTGRLPQEWVSRALERTLLLSGTRVPIRQAPSSTIPPGEEIGRYRVEELVGSGGMADVYRAFDTELHRHVAIKFLREGDAGRVDRFMREARAQAHVDHEHVCRVFEAGVLEGRPFIAMQWISGMTLADAAPSMALEEKVAILADVAEAVQAAHRGGLVHRDLKPNNIMLEAREEGGWHAYVLDFGLARDQSSSTMTSTGVIMGTPSYMAPEQARGETSQVDRRTDVYALGATMYDILAGRPPHVGHTNVEVVLKVIGEDPVPLRRLQRAIPADLETITMKCLEKEPWRRYDSARALAEDLRRYLDGEPIEARGATFVRRWATRARRHPTMAALLAGAALAVLISAGAVAVTRLRSAELTRSAQQFGQEVERIEAIARYAHMLPLHPVTAEHARIRERIGSILARKSRMGRAAVGPADYAIGRGYLALGDLHSSRRHLESAWKTGYRTPEVAWALGRVIGARYEAELAETERLMSRDAREARRRRLERELRDPALRYLRQGAGSAVESAAYGEGLIALYEQRFDEALALARKAFAEVPWLYEARTLEGDALVAKGLQLANAGRYDDALAHYRGAGEAYAAAGAIGSSDAGVLLGDAERWYRTMQIEFSRGGDAEPAMRHGIEAAERAERTGVNLEDSFRFRAAILVRWGEAQLALGQSPVDSLDRAIDMGRRALAVDPRSVRAWSLIGAALFSRARWAALHGEESIPIYDEAIRHHRRAVGLAPNDTPSLLNLANALRRKSEAVVEAGGSPIALLEESVRYYDRAVAADPDWANAHNDRCLAFLNRGEWEMQNGLDPMASLGQAARSAERAVALNPSFAAATLNLGSVHLDRADYLIRSGGDPRPALASALAAYERASALNPRLSAPHVNAGLSQMLLGQYELDAGSDPRHALERAKAEFTKALEINPEHSSCSAYLALTHLLDAQSLARAQRDPTAAIAAARRSIRRANEINRNSGDVLQMAAAIEVEAARASLSTADLDRAVQLLGRSNVINSNNADTWHTLADAWRVRAEISRRRRRDPSAEVDLALQAAERALKIDPRKGDTHALRGELLAMRGRNAEAVAAFDQALRLRPAAAWRWKPLRDAAAAGGLAVGSRQ